MGRASQIDFSSVFDTALPNVYIRKITLAPVSASAQKLDFLIRARTLVELWE